MPLTPLVTSGLEPGTVVAGRFRVEALLGEGGFGAVYRSTQLHLGREVALKVLRPDRILDFDSEAHLLRFQREAQLAQQLQHPNTIRLLDFGQTEQGLPFIAYQLLHGRPLDVVLEASGPMPPARVVRICSQVLKSLMEAHAVGIVHRDIKPANIFIVDYEGEPDFVVVLDFGIAKDIGGSGWGPAVTAHDQIIGTPLYMSPEQARGEAVGGPSDLYSLGLVMAEMLRGTSVFAGLKPIEVFLTQAGDEPVLLPAEVGGSPLGAIVGRALQKDIACRYRTAAEMLDDIAAAAEAEPSLLQRLPGFASGSVPAVRAATSKTPRPDSWPSPAAPASAPSAGRDRLVVLGVLGALAVFLALSLALIAAIGRGSEPVASGSVPAPQPAGPGSVPAPPPPPSPPAAPDSGSAPLSGPARYPVLAPLDPATVTADQLVARVRELGWVTYSVGGTEFIEAGPYVATVSFQVARRGVAGVVNLYRFRLGSLADRMLEFWQSQGLHATARSGDFVLTVSIFGQGRAAPDDALSTELLDAILGRPPRGTAEPRRP